VCLCVWFWNSRNKINCGGHALEIGLVSPFLFLVLGEGVPIWRSLPDLGVCLTIALRGGVWVSACARGACVRVCFCVCVWPLLLSRIALSFPSGFLFPRLRF
jgi:hypothetical protein